MKSKVILSAGGTGGHLFPAQNLATALSDWDVLFAAGGLKSNRYFDRESFLFEEIECATFSLSRPMHIVKGCGQICRGVIQSRQILRRYRPDLVVGFGSFFTLPLLAAALLEKIPFILHEQNAIPGKVNRLFSHFAHTTAITFPATRHYLKGNGAQRAVEVFFPLGKKTKVAQEEMWTYFGLRPSKPTLLVFGGSQGATRLNTLFLDAVAQLPTTQVLHFTGSAARAAEAQRRYAELHIPACVKPFEKHMDRAMQIADLAITRAGAATIEELIAYELPALLIPHPYATEDHQSHNATHFVSHVKGGSMYKESTLEPGYLAKMISQHLPLLPKWRENIAEYKKHRPGRPFAEYIQSVFTKC